VVLLENFENLGIYNFKVCKYAAFVRQRIRHPRARTHVPHVLECHPLHSLLVHESRYL
jgi:hypothetical protein